MAPTTTQPLFLYPFTSHTFTNAGATGPKGPTLSQVQSAYSSANWASKYLNMANDNGIQLWTVPTTGNYIIQAIGAAAGNPGSYCRGRDVQLTTNLIKGDVIKILVGQQGIRATVWSWDPASGGGGGTFVVKDAQTPIIIAGGGGGRGETATNEFINSNASEKISGNKGGSGGGSNNGDGGNNGNGGNSGHGGGGGGLLTDGKSPANLEQAGRGGKSFINGGIGGDSTFYLGIGGFGGGGGCGAGGGGGGGYSGGGCGFDPNWQPGGGGGSYGITTLKDNGATNTGHGSVIITLSK
jgi:tripartite motif-containing protein 56